MHPLVKAVLLPMHGIPNAGFTWSTLSIIEACGESFSHYTKFVFFKHLSSIDISLQGDILNNLCISTWTSCSYCNLGLTYAIKVKQ